MDLPSLVLTHKYVFKPSVLGDMLNISDESTRKAGRLYRKSVIICNVWIS